MGFVPYRPQFAYESPPEGFRDEEFLYVFAASNTPVLGQPLLPGQFALNISFPLETDSEFHLRSIEVLDPSLGQVAGLRFRDPFGIPLSDKTDWVPSAVYEVSGQGIPMEPEVVCPPGSAFQLDLMNLG